ncbi:MAG: tripartite tricarboxylate transporter TctB family protein [Caulobacter sp.]|nr:tripartite tricarboxylate transporter TctB family protein [Vitreoscilla sp.]
MDKSTKDRIGGALLVATGLSVVVAGASYGMGSLRQMGSGFFPAVLGALMASIGAALLASARRAPAGAASAPLPEMAHLAGPVVQWRGWLCILGGVAAFVVLGEHGGLVPASFVSVFVAAMGDRGNTWRSAAALAALMTALGVVVFHFGLHLLLPLFTW